MKMANIREHCSWVTVDQAAATDKAKALVRGAVARARPARAAARCASRPSTRPRWSSAAASPASRRRSTSPSAGRKVYLVERESSIGGHMAKFDKTFPTLDCAACILTPKMVQAAQHKNIELLTYSEIEEVSGLRRPVQGQGPHARRAWSTRTTCNGCGLCWGVCPARVGAAEASRPDRRHAASPRRRPSAIERRRRASRASAQTLDKIRKDCEKRAAEHDGGQGRVRHVRPLRAGLSRRRGRSVSSHREEGRRQASVIFAKDAEQAASTAAPAPRSATPSWLTMPPDDGAVLRHDELLLGPNAAIALPFMQAVPPVPVIDRESCIHFKTGGCTVCKDVCEKQAIDFEQQDEVVELEVGSIIMATGFKPFDPEPMLSQYGYGRLPNVVTALEFELLNNASGPTGGKILARNGKPPESVALIHCVGSRDKNYHEYCSRVCCMMALKYAHLIHEKTGAAVYDFYIDMRCFGKGYEEFYNRLLDEGVLLHPRPGGEVTRLRDLRRRSAASSSSAARTPSSAWSGASRSTWSC